MPLTISNLDLDVRVAFGDILYASNDFRHNYSVGEGMARDQKGCSNDTGAADSPKTSRTGYLMNDEANVLAAGWSGAKGNGWCEFRRAASDVVGTAKILKPRWQLERMSTWASLLGNYHQAE